MNEQAVKLNEKVKKIQLFWKQRRDDRYVESKYLRTAFDKSKKFVLEYFSKKTTPLAKKIQKGDINLCVTKELQKFYIELKQAESLC